MTSAESMYFSSPRMSLPSVPSAPSTSSGVSSSVVSPSVPSTEQLTEQNSNSDINIITTSFSTVSTVSTGSTVSNKEDTKGDTKNDTTKDTPKDSSKILSRSLSSTSLLRDSSPSNPSSLDSGTRRSKTPKRKHSDISNTQNVHNSKTPTKSLSSLSSKTPINTPRDITESTTTTSTVSTVPENKVPKLSFDGIKNKIESHVSSRSLPVLSPTYQSDDESKLGDKLRSMYINYHEKIKKERIKLKINKIETDATRLASIGKEEMIFYTPLSPTLVTELEKSGVRYIEDHKKKKYCITWVYD